MASSRRGQYQAKVRPAAPVDKFDALVDQYENHLLTTTNELSVLLDKSLTPGIAKLEQWGKTNTQFNSNLPLHKKMLDQLGTWAVAQEGGDMSLTFAKVQKLMKECVPLFAEENDLDHTEFNKVSFKLRGIYEALLRMEAKLKTGNRKPRSDKVIGYEVSTPEAVVGESYNKEVPTKLTVRDLRKLTEDIRQLMLVALAMGRLDTSVYGDDFTQAQMEALLIQEIDSWSQTELQGIKDTQVDVVRGIGTMGAEWLKKEDNRGDKANLEKRLGSTAARKLLNPLNKRKNTFDKKFGSIDWSRIEGSNSIDKELHTQTVALLQGKFAKPHKANTKVKKGAKSSSKAKILKAKALKAKRANAGKKYAMAALAAIKLKQGPNAKREGKNTNGSLRNLLNKKLPAEVRRNMGRPALINQTSRFSNSVYIQSIKDTAAGISMDYSYMISPYETFENTGKARWPSGYNPKKLIAKSIRNLAIGNTQKKLASLRRR